jgi:hypothetical protein
VLAVEVDSTERKDIPPFGGEIDYLTVGEFIATLRLRAGPTCLLKMFSRDPTDVLSSSRNFEVRCYLDETKPTRPRTQAHSRAARWFPSDRYKQPRLHSLIESPTTTSR